MRIVNIAVQIVTDFSRDEIASGCKTGKTRGLKFERSIFVDVNIRCWHSRDSVGLEITVVDVGLNSESTTIHSRDNCCSLAYCKILVRVMNLQKMEKKL